MDNFRETEKKWKKFWEENGELYKAVDPPSPKATSGEKKYILVEFPYPSGSGLHVGHAFSFTGGDVYARFKRMQGENVLFPMGWDAFGLPTENYAIKMKKKPQEVTKENTDMFRKQMKDLAFSFDWSREVNTTDPGYYKWTQWIFIQLFKKGLAYKKEMPINWCPSCKIGLANEEVLQSKTGKNICERCGAEVSRRNISQWVVKITEYADKLIEGLKETHFIEKVKQAQVNWIGKSEGAKIKFKLSADSSSFLSCSRPLALHLGCCARKNDASSAFELEVFTTRPDTLFGVTFMVVAPEHSLVSEILNPSSNSPLDRGESKNNPALSREGVGEGFDLNEIKKYVASARKKSDLERAELSKDKTGVFSGLYAINPVNKKEIPIWISDFVLASYGTGAIMAVPAHDERDNAFAKKFGLDIIPVIEPITGKENEGEEFRKSIVALVRNPKNGKLLSINWGKLGGNLFVGGGIENGEDLVETAKREILEETGYKNVRLLEVSEKIHHHYFAASKNVNRSIEVVGMFFELENEEKQEVGLEENEKDKFTVEWISEKDAETRVADELHKYVFDKFIKRAMFAGRGIMTNSGKFDGLDSDEAKEKIIKWLEEKGIGEKTASYHLRDWIFSRQHYWGEPIPMVNCSKCGWVPVDEKDLPIKLPEVEAYEPTDDGKSPLAKIESFVKTKCPKCGGKAERETDTMPNWAGSDWYFLRYIDPHNDTFIASNELMKYWCPVDVYIGGDEHNVLHLLYSRFIYKFLWDLGSVPKKYPEPYIKRLSHGVVLGPDNQRMSKSKGNVIVPEVVADKYGVDVVRMYLMFMGPFDSTMAWNENTLMGVKRFLDRFEQFIKRQVDKSDSEVVENKEVKVVLNKTIKNITDMIEQFKYNTAIAQMMELLNNLSGSRIGIKDTKTLVKLLAPFAPYTAEEMYFSLNNVETRDCASLQNYISVHASEWPKADPKYLVDDEVTIIIAINGKVRDQLIINNEELIIKEEVIKKAKGLEKIKKWVENKEIIKEIYIPGKMVNLVVKL